MMNMKSGSNIDILIAIPVYNHGKTLRDVVERSLAVHDSVMVVDDGSTDRGIDTLEGLDVHVVRHEKNLGKGAAILTAAHEARKLKKSHLICLDADGQHDPGDIKLFIPLIHRNPWAIIVGKRNFTGNHVPGATRFGRKFSNFWLRLQTGKKINDVQSGFRAYPVAVMENLKLRERRYSFEVEVLVKAAWAGIDLLETDIAVYYPPNHERVSHFDLFMDNVRISWLNTKLTLMSAIPVPRRQIIKPNHVNDSITVLHPLRSIKTLLTENTSPRRLAAAGALGIFLGTLPLIAFHTIAILFAASFFRLNKVAAVSASQLCMPPIVPALCIETGYFIRHGEFLTEVSLRTLGYEGLQRLFEWLIGSLILAPVMALGVGCVIYILAIWVKREKHATA